MDPTARFTALIVDDNYYNRDLCTLALEHVGYEVEEAENGIQALVVLADRSFDLLVLDLAMPELDGTGVVRKIRTQEIHNQMTVIILTANHHMATSDLDEMVDYVMFKPINIEEFAQFARRLTQMKKIS